MAFPAQGEINFHHTGTRKWQIQQEIKWLRFSDDPSTEQSWNNYPDFQHAFTGENLWFGSSYCSKWVQPRRKCLEDVTLGQGIWAHNMQGEGASIQSKRSSCLETDGRETFPKCDERQQQVKTNISTLLAALKASSSSRDLNRGKKIHADAIARRDDSNIYVASTLVNMYAKCGSMVDARRVFDRMSCHDVVSWNALMLGYAENGEGEVALQLFARMIFEGCPPNPVSFLAALKACINLAAVEADKQVQGKLWGSLEKGMAIHSQAVKSGCDSEIYVANTLVDMYAKCGSLVDARGFFDRMPFRDVASWTALTLGYAVNGEGEVALHLFARMQFEGCAANRVTFLAVLKACTSLTAKEEGKEVDGKLVKIGSLEKGMAIHAQAAKSGCDSDIFVASTLVDMYAKCGSIGDARWVFDRMPRHNVESWTVLILGYVENGEGEVALKLFACMQPEGCTPNAFVAALRACTSLAQGKQVDGQLLKMRSLEKGMAIHAQAAKSGYDSEIYVANTLVDMYAKCGSMEDARGVFDRMGSHDVVSWNALMLGYSENGEGEVALHLFQRMQFEGCARNRVTFLAALKACTSLAAKEEGKQVDVKLVKMVSLEKGMGIHSKAAISGCESEIVVANTLVDMYAKCGSMVDARGVFDRMPHHDVVSWSVLMLGYAENGEGKVALQLFACMLGEGCGPNARTFVAALKACTSLAIEEVGKQIDGKLVKMGSLEKGMAIHSQAAKGCCDSEIYVSNTLVDMYAKCGSMVDARGVFDRMLRDDVVLWTALMLGYVENGEGEVALQLFACMPQEGCALDARTFVAALKACTSLAAQEEGNQVDRKLVKMGCLQKGMAVHSQAAKNGCDSEIYVANTLVDMYAKCGSMVDARGVFDRMLCHDVVSWNALLLGYAENGEGKAALQLFARMRLEGCAPDARTFVAALKACGSVAALEIGKTIHADIRRCGLESNAVIAHCLVDFYGKCGSMVDAQQVFDSIVTKDLVTWTALIAGYSRQGDAKHVFNLFEKMQKERVQADGITFLSILVACSHAGHLDKGKEYFQAMCSKYGITPSIDHYTCMVDLLGRANQLDDAVAMVKNMPFQPDCVIWMTVLGACCKWTNLAVGRLAFDSLLKLDDKHAPAYVLMANIYAAMCEETRNRTLTACC